MKDGNKRIEYEKFSYKNGSLTCEINYCLGKWPKWRAALPAVDDFVHSNSTNSDFHVIQPTISRRLHPVFFFARMSCACAAACCNSNSLNSNSKWSLTGRFPILYISIAAIGMSCKYLCNFPSAWNGLFVSLTSNNGKDTKKIYIHEWVWSSAVRKIRIMNFSTQFCSICGSANVYSSWIIHNRPEIGRAFWYSVIVCFFFCFRSSNINCCSQRPRWIQTYHLHE